jgi:hypothetical protein
MYALQLLKFHGSATSSHPKKANLLSSMKMWSFFFVGLLVHFFFFLSFFLGMLSVAAPKTTPRVMTFLEIEFINSILVQKKTRSGGRPQDFHPQSQQAVARAVASSRSRQK